MLKPNMSHIVQLMRRSVDRMQLEGAIRPGSKKIVRLEEVFPFRPQDVEGIDYAEKDSIRFHLKNGRIFDGFGKPAEQPGMPGK
ncbi:MAG: hypothetical protein EPN97_09225 [Alphaproteobacteria bacterium]|nr:MAG: hypothetical protein EPN97_09225 [Alphaproteobacteria bacterium]